jgi:tetratricopeptide (TPR) repeat protein
VRIRTILAVAGAVLLIGAPAFAQEGSESLEKEARKAFNGGQFRRAALKFESAASAAGDPARKGRMLVQSAWASFNEGKRTDSQEALRRAYAASPDLEIVPDFYSPEFVKVAADVKAALRTTPSAPPADVAELKRVARQKLADGFPEDVIHDLTYNVPREKLDAECLDLLAAAYDKVGKFNEASRIRAAKGDPAKASLPAVAPAAAAAPTSVAAAGAPAPSGPPPSAPAAPSSAPTRTAGGAAPAVDYLALGRNALSHGDALNAQSAANRLLEVDPQSSDAYRLLGNAFTMRGEKVLAEANLKQAIKYNEKNEGALLDLYDFYMADKSWEPALDALRKAAEINPENRDKLVALGRKARADGDLVHARQVFATAAATAPKDASILTEYAAVLLQMKDLDAALEPLTKAAAAEPDREIVRANLASVLRRKGLWKEAEKEYREAIRSDPDYAPALTGLGGLLLERGQAADAIEPLKKAVLRAPQSVDAAWALARAQRQTGALKEAADSIEKPLALDAPELWNEAGAIAMERGRWDEAVIFFDKAVSRDGTVPLYKANRDRATAAAAFVKSAAPAGGGG